MCMEMCKNCGGSGDKNGKRDSACDGTGMVPIESKPLVLKHVAVDFNLLDPNNIQRKNV